MEHRHDGEHDSPCREIHHVRLRFGYRMNDIGAMLIEHAFRIASCTAGIAKTAGIILINIYPLKITIFGINKFAESGVFALLAIKLDIMFNGFELRLEHLDNRGEHLVEQQHPVFGMVDDVNQLLLKQARV